MAETIRISDIDQRRLQRWLSIQASTKPKVYVQIFASTDIDSLNYWLEIIFSAGIATLGLVESSPAVIIGAMLMSPLMGPIMAMGLALTVGDLYLGFKSAINLLISVAVSIAFSGFLVWLLPFHSLTAEIVARTNPSLLDLGIALFSGLAGSVVVCRGGTEGVTALPGVAIAVALMPPLCVIGYGLGSGVNAEIMGGAGLLFLTNLVAIVATAFLVFLLVGMNTPAVEKAMIATRGDEPMARILSQGRVASVLAAGGRLRWRVLAIVVLLGSIAVPLHRALLQLANEAFARTEVQAALKRLLPSDDIASQQVTIANGAIVIRLISTRQIPDSKVNEVREDLARRTGLDIQLSVDAIASRSELAELMDRLARPTRLVIPGKKTVEENQKELLDQVRPVIEESWQFPDAPMQDFDVVVGTAGVVIHVRYQAAADPGDAAIAKVQQSLRTILGMPDLTLKTERIQPAGIPVDSGGASGKGRRR